VINNHVINLQFFLNYVKKSIFDDCRRICEKNLFYFVECVKLRNFLRPLHTLILAMITRVQTNPSFDKYILKMRIFKLLNEKKHKSHKNKKLSFIYVNIIYERFCVDWHEYYHTQSDRTCARYGHLKLNVDKISTFNYQRAARNAGGSYWHSQTNFHYCSIQRYQIHPNRTITSYKFFRMKLEPFFVTFEFLNVLPNLTYLHQKSFIYVFLWSYECSKSRKNLTNISGFKFLAGSVCIKSAKYTHPERIRSKKKELLWIFSKKEVIVVIYILEK